MRCLPSMSAAIAGIVIMRASWLSVPQCAPASIAGPSGKIRSVGMGKHLMLVFGVQQWIDLRSAKSPIAASRYDAGLRASRAQFPLAGIVAIAPMAWTRDGCFGMSTWRDEKNQRALSATREAAFRVLSGVRSIACAQAAPDPGNPAPRRGIVLAASAAPCRQAGAGARGQDRTARRMAVASRI